MSQIFNQSYIILHITSDTFKPNFNLQLQDFNINSSWDFNSIHIIKESLKEQRRRKKSTYNYIPYLQNRCGHP